MRIKIQIEGQKQCTTVLILFYELRSVALSNSCNRADSDSNRRLPEILNELDGTIVQRETRADTFAIFLRILLIGFPLLDPIHTSMCTNLVHNSI